MKNPLKHKLMIHRSYHSANDFNVLPVGTKIISMRLIRQRRTLRTVAYYATPVLLLTIAVCLINPPFFVSNDNTSAMTGTSIASDTTLSLAIENGTLALDLTPTSHSGSFATTSTSAVIKVSTNNITGYTLGIKSSNASATNADKLVNTDTGITTRNTIASLQSAVSLEDYRQNNLDNVDLNNTWGYSPSYYNSMQNTNESTNNNPIYYPAPVEGDILNITDSPNPVDDTILDNNNEPTGELQQDEYTINFGSRIDYSIYSGTYTNPTTFIITAVGNQVPYSVSYNENKPTTTTTNDEVLNMPTAQTGTVQGGDTIAVIINTRVPAMKDTTTPETPTYSGYVFKGWCTEQTTETLDQTTGKAYQSCPEQATIYQPGDSIGIDQTTDDNTQTLYAIWGAPATVTFNGNGLIYDNDTTNTVNTVQYIPTYEGNKITGQRTNTIYTGTYKTPAYEETDPATNYIFKGWSTDSTATTATYTNEQEITEDLTLSSGDNIELYAIWNYTVKITFNKNNADGTETMNPQYIEVGTTASLEQNIYTNTGYEFAGWNTVQTPTEQDPGETYADQANFTAGSQSADVTLYAQWIVPPPTLYDNVAAMSKGTQTNDSDAATGIQAAIVAPTEADPVSSNSGVYEYNAAVFGSDSDANNSNNGKDTIYYYRGILDSYGHTGTYGSDGLADAYPNYVILQSGSSKATTDTCWRIVRTTGSGGVKMIYNGTWTGSTCANALDNAQVGTSAFNGTSSTNRQMVRVGYTYNSTYATNTKKSGTIAQIFGTNSNPSVNDTRSTIKEYIEDTWYAKNMTAYTSILEPSAGYCNDRTMNTSDSWTTPLAESSTIVATYGTSSLQAYHFGAYVRNKSYKQRPSLTCAKRSTVDLYRYVQGSNDVSNELKYPAALLTADELSFAGSGSTGTDGSSYHANSFLRSGNTFWSLSPYIRDSNGDTFGFSLKPNGRLNTGSVFYTSGVRPAISLKPGTTAASGTGIATDPWVVTAP